MFVLARRGLGRLYGSARRYGRGLRNLFRSPADIFTEYYRTNKWRSAESRSGEGSEVGITAGIREAIPPLLRRLDVRSVLDVPCGDFNWMQHVDLTGIHYTGADIVREMIESNRSRHGSAQRSFILCDATQDNLPQADLILCRDMLVHLSTARIHLALQNFQRSNSTYLLTTHFPSVEKNQEIVTGMWRPLNLERPPFSFPAPVWSVVDQPGQLPRGDKVLALWKLSDIPRE